MDGQKLQLKFFVAEPFGFQLEPFVPVFHDWIRRKLLGTETLIDVADYAHVHHGPGILLVGHQSDYYIDLGQGRPGLLFSRKREALAEPAANIQDAFRRALYACSLLEQETAFQNRFDLPRTKRFFESTIDFVHRIRRKGFSRCARSSNPSCKSCLAELRN